jgi:hypothetical protein
MAVPGGRRGTATRSSTFESIVLVVHEGARPVCRNIRTLHNFEPPATTDEVRAAAIQYVRKVSGAAKPSQANEAAFARAVDAVTEATRRLLDELVTTAPPKNREVEAAKARERAAVRYGSR